MKKILIVGGLLLSTPLWAEDQHRDLDSHVHGEVEMNVAVSGQLLSIEVISPAHNILGFEHEAQSAKDKRTLKQALKTLKQPVALIMPNKQAQCTVKTSNVESSLKHEDHNEHDDEHAEHKHDDHDDHEEHAEHKDEHEEGHANVNLYVEFSCAKPQQLSTLDSAGLFKAFPLIEDIHVQWLTDSKQSSAELSPNRHKISLQ